MGLIEVLEDQIIFQFTGRVNILKKDNNQFLGTILLKDGEIISCEYNKVLGMKGIYNLVIDELTQDLQYIIEPEIIELTEKNISEKIIFNELKARLGEYITEYNRSLKLRPPPEIRLSINPKFILNGEEISAKEFDILCVISDYNRVKEIYNNSKFLDYEITNTLVSLRKKGALVVLK